MGGKASLGSFKKGIFNGARDNFNFWPQKVLSLNLRYWAIILNMKWKFTLCRTIASYMIPLGGLDALVFTGGIGEKSRIKREKILGNVFSMRINFQSIIGDDDQAVVKKRRSHVFSRVNHEKF